MQESNLAYNRSRMSIGTGKNENVVPRGVTEILRRFKIATPISVTSELNFLLGNEAMLHHTKFAIHNAVLSHTYLTIYHLYNATVFGAIVPIKSSLQASI